MQMSMLMKKPTATLPTFSIMLIGFINVCCFQNTNPVLDPKIESPDSEH
jgi:hypothetical protein